MYGMYDRTAFSEKVQDSLSRLPEEKKKKKKKKKKHDCKGSGFHMTMIFFYFSKKD